MALRNIHLRVLFTLCVISASGSAADPTLVCLGKGGMLARDSQGKMTQESFDAAAALLGRPEWKSLKARFEPAAATEKFRSLGLTGVLQTSCTDGTAPVLPDVWVIVTPVNDGASVREAVVHFIYQGGVLSAAFVRKGETWQKSANEDIPLKKILPDEVALANDLISSEKKKEWEHLTTSQDHHWAYFWDTFITERLADKQGVSRLIGAESEKKWLRIVTVGSPADLPSPAYAPVVPPAAKDEKKAESGFPTWLFGGAFLSALVAGFAGRPVFDKMRLSRLESRRRRALLGTFQSPTGSARGSQKPKAQTPTEPPSTGLTTPALVNTLGLVNTEGLADLAAQLGRQIETGWKIFDSNSDLIQEASKQMDASTKKLSDASLQVLKDSQPLLRSASTLNDANTAIESVTRELKTTVATLKKDTASLPALSSQFEKATAGITSSADKLAASNEKALTLLSQLQQSAAKVAIAERDASDARAAEKTTRDLAERLTQETASLRARLDADPLSAASPVLAKLEDDLKKALRNFSGSTRDRTGLTSPLLALLTSHCLYLLILAVKNNDALLQSAMRSNLSRITELGSGLNLLGFQQARETLQNAGWFTGRLGQQYESNDSDLKDASWFQTALKYIQDRENLALGPFYVGLDARGKVQYVN